MTACPLLITAVLLVLAYTNPAAAVCDPDCSGHGPGDKVEDPRDCTQYYICVDVNEPSLQPLSCDASNVFDPLYGECIPGEACEPSCVPPSCKVRCDAVLDVIASPWDCSTYYYCDAAYNPGAPQQCPAERPYFDGETCSSDESVCCETSCTPNCGPGDVQIPDPADCTKYYLCVEEGHPSEENHHTCENGQTFQPSSSLCVPGGTCYTLCGDPPTTTTTSTTTTDSTTTSTTTTTTPTTTVTFPTTTGEWCVAFLTCSSPGYFPMCNYCQPGYFECRHEGDNGVPMLCPDGYAFNTNPDYPLCVLMDECPYPPVTSS